MAFCGQAFTQVAFPAKVRLNIHGESSYWINMHNVRWANINAVTTSITACLVYKSRHGFPPIYLVLFNSYENAAGLYHKLTASPTAQEDFACHH